MQDDRTYRTLLLETLTAFSDVCRQAGIRWWLAFGSAIGAVRHGGMIPWDDDVDVMMPRADYERFLRLQVPGYEILSLSCSADDLPFGYAKFLHRGTTLIEQRRYPRPLGVFIDVFPLDAAGPDPEAFRCAYRGALRDYVRSFRLHFWDEWCSDLFHGRWHAVFAAVKDLLLYRPRKAALRRRVLALDRRAAEVSGAGCAAGALGSGAVGASGVVGVSGSGAAGALDAVGVSGSGAAGALDAVGASGPGAAGSLSVVGVSGSGAAGALDAVGVSGSGAAGASGVAGVSGSGAAGALDVAGVSGSGAAGALDTVGVSGVDKDAEVSGGPESTGKALPSRLAIWSTNSEYRGITFPAQWFSETVLVPFEGLQAPLPVGNDALLTLLYGDYMTLPPVSEQRSFHHHWFLDLTRGPQ